MSQETPVTPVLEVLAVDEQGTPSLVPVPGLTVNERGEIVRATEPLKAIADHGSDAWTPDELSSLAASPPTSQSEPPAVNEGPPARTEPLKVTLKRRLEAEGRWTQVEPLRNQMMREARGRGMSKEDAQEWVYEEIGRLYPPLQAVVMTPDEQPETQVDYGEGVSNHIDGGDDPSPARPREGLGGLPADWPTLPDNAALVAELGWVQAQRLRIVEERPGGQTVVRLGRAGCPPPSWAALGWLDTAIRNPAKWADLCAKGMSQQELESDLVKRERRAVTDVRTLLSEMHEHDTHK